MLTKKNKILIQQKIEGKLTPEEEAAFEQLLFSSEKARVFYLQLKQLHEVIVTNVENTPRIDLVEDVMQRIDATKMENDKIASPKKGVFAFTLDRRFLAYAAMLAFGLLIGSVATYFSLNREFGVDNEVITGTMIGGAKHDLSYNNEGNKINITKHESAAFVIYTIAVDSDGIMYCKIEDVKANFTENNLTLVNSNGNFSLIDKDETVYTYLSEGENVFTIYKETDLKSYKLKFYVKGKLLSEYEIQ